MLWVRDISNQGSILFPGVHCFPRPLALASGCFSLSCYLPWLPLWRELENIQYLQVGKPFLAVALGTKLNFKQLEFQIFRQSYESLNYSYNCNYNYYKYKSNLDSHLFDSSQHHVPTDTSTIIFRTGLSSIKCTA